MVAAEDDIDLYEVLEVPRDASTAQIKKAYHKAALSSHPDKVPESERAEAEVRFKTVSQAYEILSNDDSRHLYDTHGMAAFEKSSGGPGGMGADVDLDDILAQMFGGMGGMGGMPGAAGGPRMKRQGPRKGRNEEQKYEVTLEELYKGKTTRFASTKNVVCGTCNGTGGKEKAKAKTCDSCKGQGVTLGLRSVGPGLVTQETVPCAVCKGAGQIYKDKDRCRKCKGARVVETRKVLELYIPHGSREGDRIVLKGEADQQPDQEPGDIIFELVEKPHPVFSRAGADLQAELKITLAEALTGFSRVVLTHLDGRGIQLHVLQPRGKILRPDQVVRVPGEGMPIKKSEAKGDLYLVVKIQFPEDGWVKDEAMLKQIQNILPKPQKPISVDVVDEVDFEEQDNLDNFGAGSDDPRAGGAWEDEDAEDGQPQCAQQ